MSLLYLLAGELTSTGLRLLAQPHMSYASELLRLGHPCSPHPHTSVRRRAPTDLVQHREQHTGHHRGASRVQPADARWIGGVTTCVGCHDRGVEACPAVVRPRRTQATHAAHTGGMRNIESRAVLLCACPTSCASMHVSVCSMTCLKWSPHCPPARQFHRARGAPRQLGHGATLTK